MTKEGFTARQQRGGFEARDNGELIVLRAATKPYSTLMSPCASVNIDRKPAQSATVERFRFTRTGLRRGGEAWSP